MVWDVRIAFSKSSTRNIASGSTKFLGHPLGKSLQASCQAAFERIRKRVQDALKLVDQRPVRGEYKVWIFKNYLAPSLFFLLAIDAIPESVTKSLQSSATRFNKKCLNLRTCATPRSSLSSGSSQSSISPHLRDKAKLAFLSQIEASIGTHILDRLKTT